jgi:hypothetical protein
LLLQAAAPILPLASQHDVERLDTLLPSATTAQPQGASANQMTEGPEERE